CALPILMGARVEEMLALAMRSFSERNVQLARSTMHIDRIIDQLELEIDERCLQILARRQPVASDLRFITTTLKLVTDLERIGDLCVNLCERVIELGDDIPAPNTTPLPRLAEVAPSMPHHPLDRIVDAHYAQLFPELVASMMADPQTVQRSTRLLSIGKHLERIADHATNIAEMVVFMVRGQDIRHAGMVSQGVA